MTTIRSTRHTIVLLGGGVVDATSIGELEQSATVIAADSGAELADALGLSVDAIVGDLDSLSPAALAALTALGTTVIRHPTDKNETDAELAILHAVAHGARRVTLVGAWGGRIDHQLSLLALLFHAALNDVDVEARLGIGRVHPVRAGQSRTITCQPGSVIGLIPFGGDAHRVRTEGLHWALLDETLSVTSSRGVSNRSTTERFTVAIGGGRLLAVVHPPELAGTER